VAATTNQEGSENTVRTVTTDFGLTRIVTCDYSSDPIETALDKQKVTFTRRELPNIVGMGGNAWLLNYTSPKTGLPVTVLVTPHRFDIDDFAETYYYFEDMDWAVATAGDVDTTWTERYDRCREVDQAIHRTVTEEAWANLHATTQAPPPRTDTDQPGT
jgi:hypothetical protein